MWQPAHSLLLMGRERTAAFHGADGKFKRRRTETRSENYLACYAPPTQSQWPLGRETATATAGLHIAYEPCVRCVCPCLRTCAVPCVAGGWTGSDGRQWQWALMGGVPSARACTLTWGYRPSPWVRSSGFGFPVGSSYWYWYLRWVRIFRVYKPALFRSGDI